MGKYPGNMVTFRFHLTTDKAHEKFMAIEQLLHKVFIQGPMHREFTDAYPGFWDGTGMAMPDPTKERDYFIRDIFIRLPEGVEIEVKQ